MWFSTDCSVCTECPAGTEPVVGFEYKWWNTMPANMKSTVYNQVFSDSNRRTGENLNIREWGVGGLVVHWLTQQEWGLNPVWGLSV